MKDPAHRLFFLLRDLVQCCQEGESLQAKAHHLSIGESRALMAIKTDNCQSTSDLASHLGVAKSRITRIADMLVEKELVTRNQNAGDRRLCLLKLTPKGDRLANDLVESFMELHGEVIQALPTGSQSETLSTLAALSEAMNSIRMRLKQKSSESEEI